MTRPSNNKRLRLAQDRSSPTTLTTTLSAPSAPSASSASNLSSRSSTTSSTTITGTSTVGGTSVTSNTGAPLRATSSSTRPSPPQHQQHFPVQHPYPSTQQPTRDLRRTPSSLSTISQAPASLGGHSTGAPTHHMPQHPESGTVPASSPTSANPSASYHQTHLERYQGSRQDDQDFKPPAPSGHYMVTQPLSTSRPLTSPIGPPSGHSSSAPPFVTHPPPPGDHYQQRNQYPGPNPNIPPATPTSSSFADRQQSAPVGAPHQPGMGAEHPQHHGYGPPPHSMEIAVNGAPTVLQNHSAMYQPVNNYPPPSPHHGPPGGGYYGEPQAQPYQSGPNQPWPQHPPQQQQSVKLAVKKNSRAHVACNNCRQRKQKCDEQPVPPGCSYCQQEGLECIYREVAQPKVDRNIATLQEELKANSDELKATSEKLDQMRKDIAIMMQMLKSQQHQAPTATNGTPMNQPTLALVSEHSTFADDEEEETGNIKESAPGEHSTGAQHLSKKFPMTERWFKAAGVTTCESYPYELESKRGTPRIFGAGWSGDDPISRGPEANSIYHAAYTPASYEKFNKGGINPNGTLRIDSHTVKRLHDSYMRHMWVIYPILNAEELKQRVSTFCASYSPEDEPKPATPPGPPLYNALSPHGSTGMKRSFSQMHESTYHDPGVAGSGKRPLDYSLNNAIILLVLALGKLCEHDDYIMEGEIPKPDPFPEDSSASQASSPNYARGSSSRSTNSSSSPKFPNQIMNVNHSFGHVNASAKNVEKLPGLAYYSEAAAILGHCVGRRGLDAVHAYILAGLYWGQMGFVLQAADWIHMAGNAIIEVLYTLPAEDITVNPERPWIHRPIEVQNSLDLFLFSFWTLQQMEGDILAELERLAPSRLGTHQQINGLDVRIPSGLVGVGTASHPYALFNGHLELSNVGLHFSSQLSLRIYLNRAHLALYSTDQQKEAAINKQRELTWADLKPEHLWDTVQGWRRGLPKQLSWSDSEDPSSDILQARLRAKYYGFVYIVSRKILEDVAKQKVRVDWSEFAKLKNATLQDLENEDMRIVGVACKRCILAAMASTTAFDNTCDGTKKRARLPNIMGTFTAQFSNVLILSYCYLDTNLRQLIANEGVIVSLLQRTIRVLNNLSPMSPVFKTNKEILLKAYEDVIHVMGDYGIQYPAALIDQRSNIIQGTSWPTPIYGSPGVHSGPLSQGPNTPQDHYTTSAATSFSAPR